MGGEAFKKKLVHSVLLIIMAFYYLKSLIAGILKSHQI